MIIIELFENVSTSSFRVDKSNLANVWVIGHGNVGCEIDFFGDLFLKRTVWFWTIDVLSSRVSNRVGLVMAKARQTFLLPTKCSSNEKMNDLQRWLRAEKTFLSVSFPALLGFGRELVDLDVHHRRWYRKVIFSSLSTKFSSKRGKRMRKRMKQEQVSMCFLIRLPLCVMRSYYGKFLLVVRFK